MEAVGFLPRLGAALIDAVILFVAMTIVAFVGLGGLSLGAAMSGASVLGAILVMAYYSLEVFKAATPGKMALGLVIRNADGTPASQETLTKRYVTKQSGSVLNFLAALTGFGLFATLGAIAGLVIFVGCFLVLTESKQALHDRVALTKVFKV